MEVSYNKNTGLVLDADLTFLVVDASVSVRARSCLNSRLIWDPRFLRSTSEVICVISRPVSDVERRVAQTCTWNETRDCSDRAWDKKFLRFTLDRTQS